VDGLKTKLRPSEFETGCSLLLREGANVATPPGVTAHSLLEDNTLAKLRGYLATSFALDPKAMEDYKDEANAAVSRAKSQ
jgi:hypothetical protein